MSRLFFKILVLSTPKDNARYCQHFSMCQGRTRKKLIQVLSFRISDQPAYLGEALDHPLSQHWCGCMPASFARACTISFIWMFFSDPQAFVHHLIPPMGQHSEMQVELEANIPLLPQFSRVDVFLWSKVVLFFRPWILSSATHLTHWYCFG